MTRSPSRWRSLPPLLAALLVLGAVPAFAQTPVAPLGTADTTVDLGGIAADAAASGTLRLGGLRVFASTDDDPVRNAPGGGSALRRGAGGSRRQPGPVGRLR